MATAPVRKDYTDVYGSLIAATAPLLQMMEHRNARREAGASQLHEQNMRMLDIQSKERLAANDRALERTRLEYDSRQKEWAQYTERVRMELDGVVKQQYAQRQMQQMDMMIEQAQSERDEKQALQNFGRGISDVLMTASRDPLAAMAKRNALAQVEGADKLPIETWTKLDDTIELKTTNTEFINPVTGVKENLSGMLTQAAAARGPQQTILVSRLLQASPGLQRDTLAAARTLGVDLNTLAKAKTLVSFDSNDLSVYMQGLRERREDILSDKTTLEDKKHRLQELDTEYEKLVNTLGTSATVNNPDRTQIQISGDVPVDTSVFLQAAQAAVSADPAKQPAADQLRTALAEIAATTRFGNLDPKRVAEYVQNLGDGASISGYQEVTDALSALAGTATPNDPGSVPKLIKSFGAANEAMKTLGIPSSLSPADFLTSSARRQIHDFMGNVARNPTQVAEALEKTVAGNQGMAGKIADLSTAFVRFGVDKIYADVSDGRPSGAKKVLDDAMQRMSRLFPEMESDDWELVATRLLDMGYTVEQYSTMAPELRERLELYLKPMHGSDFLTVPLTQILGTVLLPITEAAIVAEAGAKVLGAQLGAAVGGGSYAAQNEIVKAAARKATTEAETRHYQMLPMGGTVGRVAESAKASKIRKGHAANSIIRGMLDYAVAQNGNDNKVAAAQSIQVAVAMINKAKKDGLVLDNSKIFGQNSTYRKLILNLAQNQQVEVPGLAGYQPGAPAIAPISSAAQSQVPTGMAP